MRVILAIMLSDGAEALDEFASVHPTYLYILYAVEWWEEITLVVSHLHQIFYVDDVFLAHLHEILVERHQYVFVGTSLEAYRCVASRCHHFPHSQVVVVLEHTDILNLDESEVHGVGT